MSRLALGHGIFGGWATMENSLFEMITMQLDDMLVNPTLLNKGALENQAIV